MKFYIYKTNLFYEWFRMYLTTPKKKKEQLISKGLYFLSSFLFIFFFEGMRILRVVLNPWIIRPSYRKLDINRFVGSTCVSNSLHETTLCQLSKIWKMNEFQKIFTSLLNSRKQKASNGRRITEFTLSLFTLLFS